MSRETADTSASGGAAGQATRASMSGSRVLHLIDTGGPGGAETIFLSLVRGLERHGWHSTPVVPCDDWLAHKLREAGMTPRIIPAHGSFNVRYLANIVRLARAEGANAIQTHLLGSAVYGTLAARLLKIPVLCTFHGPADWPTDTRWGRLKRGIVARSNRIVFVSRSLSREMAPRVGERVMRRSIVIRNGVDLEVVQHGDGARFRQEIGVEPQQLLVGAVGNVRQSKDYGNLIAAAHWTLRHTDRARFVIVGDDRNGMAARLRSRVKELGLEHRVRFLGFREDLADIFAGLDVYVLSSSAEGFSLTTVQAMAAELPVVATRCGGPEDIVQDSETGFLVPAGDSGSLGRAVLRLVDDEGLRRRFGRAGADHVTGRYSVAAMVRSYAASLTELCARPGASRLRAVGGS